MRRATPIGAGETLVKRTTAVENGLVLNRRRTVEHVFGAIKDWMGRSHFKMRRLPNVGTEMSLHVLAYNLKRAIALLGAPGLIAAMRG